MVLGVAPYNCLSNSRRTRAGFKNVCMRPNQPQ
jgi:hypothetical protein